MHKALQLEACSLQLSGLICRPAGALRFTFLQPFFLLLIYRPLGLSLHIR